MEMLPIYKRNNKSCYLCCVRERLVLATPEESVRQAFLAHLTQVLEVPKDMIRVEEALSHYKIGDKGRADILVLYKDEQDNCLYPLILIECKEPRAFITNKHFEQVWRYNDVLCSEVVGITNGENNYWYAWNEQKDNYISIEGLPSYLELLKYQNIKFIEDEIQMHEKWDKNEDIQNLLVKLVEEGIMGEDTPAKFAPFIANLDNLLLDETSVIGFKALADFELVLDGGVRAASYGNASGGKWDGYYRYFMIKDNLSDNQIISFSIMGTLKREKSITTSASRGRTTLIVAFDSDDSSHNSLQLCIDDCISIKENWIEIWHDGKITVGNHGSAKRQQLIDFVYQSNPELVTQNKIVLGRLDNSKDFNFESSDVCDFFVNLLKYVLCREAFRLSFKRGLLPKLN